MQSHPGPRNRPAAPLMGRPLTQASVCAGSTGQVQQSSSVPACGVALEPPTPLPLAHPVGICCTSNDMQVLLGARGASWEATHVWFKSALMPDHGGDPKWPVAQSDGHGTETAARLHPVLGPPLPPLQFLLGRPQDWFPLA